MNDRSCVPEQSPQVGATVIGGNSLRTRKDFKKLVAELPPLKETEKATP